MLFPSVELAHFVRNCALAKAIADIIRSHVRFCCVASVLLGRGR